MSDIGHSTKRRMIFGFISNLISKLAGSIIQLVQVPVFLHFWSVPLYGEWLVVTSVPSYLSFSSFGFGSVASNEMTMSIAAGDQDRALRVFQSCWWLIIALCTLVGAVLTAAVYFFPVAHYLKLQSISPSDAKWIIFYLCCSVLLGQLEQLVGGAYTCVGRYPYGMFMKSCLSLAAFGAMMIPVALRYGARDTALVFALTNIAGTVLFSLMLRRDIPWIKFGWAHARTSEIKRLAAPAIGFMGFTVGNALNLQGSIMAVGLVLGPTDVVIFGTARTVSRVALQLVSLVNQCFWPEFALAYGAKNEGNVRSLHRKACQLALLVAFLVVGAMMAFGPWFLHRWTGGHVPPSPGLLSILLLGVVLYALWSTSCTLVLATNQHQRLAVFYTIATGITIVFTYVMARYFGLYGAAASLLLSELIMNFYVLPNSLRIAKDTFPEFLASFLRFPASLHPKELLKSLRRGRPQPEN